MIHKTFIVLFVTVCALRQGQAILEAPLETVKQWNLLNFDFPWDWPTNNKDLFNPEQIVTTGMEVGINRIFMATPRLFSGVPATITTMSRSTLGDSPVLQAFPDWSHHAAGLKQYNCSDIGLVSVYRIKIDSCNRLWALDSGVSRSLEDFEVTCPPKILVYDLFTDQVVRRIDFPPEVVKMESLFTNIIVDETASSKENHCDDAMIYITDTVAPGIVVYDSGRDLTWRLTHPSMYPDPDFSESNILGHKFTLMDGVVGLAFDHESRTVYFQPLATDRVFSVSAEVLKAGPTAFGEELPVKLVGRKSSQGLGLGASPYGGNIFFAPFTQTAIAMYNPRNQEQKVIAFDEERLQFVADFKVSDNDPGALYIITSKFHRFFLKNLDVNEVNTRILRIGGVVENSPVSLHGGQFHPIHPQHNIQPIYQNNLNNLNNGYNYQIPPQATNYAQAFPQHYANPGYNGYNYPQSYSSSIQPFPSAPTYANFPGAYQQSAPRTYTDKVASNVGYKSAAPYAFEHFGTVNKNLNNPFRHLNTGERPTLHQSRTISLQNYGLTGEVYHKKRNAHSSMSFGKALGAFNSTVYH